jgi:integrase
MKAGQVHRAPLSREALAVLKEATKYRVNDRVFPSSRRGKPISSSSLLKVLQAVGGDDSTVHGFRSTFRDWCSERTAFSREVSEMALAHTIENPAEAAYRRGELMRKRTALMAAWANFLTAPQKAGKVVPLGRRARA